MTITDTRAARGHTVPRPEPPPGPRVLNGQAATGTQDSGAAEGQDSPQAKPPPVPRAAAPAGSTAAPPARHEATSIRASLEGRETSQDQCWCDTQIIPVLADDIPGRHLVPGTQRPGAAGEQGPPAARIEASPIAGPLLADPLLALAADVLGDLEKVRIANENRLRQLTRSAEDSDGESRGFGLDEAHPDVARLAALVGMLAGAEHKATLNLQRVMRRYPLGPWVAAQKGIGEKQGARLLAAIGDPYIRPEITQENGTVEPSFPRTVSGLWAYCGLRPGQKRQRGEKANWSAAAKMRAWNIATSMLKAGNREVYDKRKAATEGRLHSEDCTRCGPKGNPADAGTPWSDGHRHADALRIVGKEVLKGLWREAKRIHEQASAGGRDPLDTHLHSAASGDGEPEAPAA